MCEVTFDFIDSSFVFIFRRARQKVASSCVCARVRLYHKCVSFGSMEASDLKKLEQLNSLFFSS